MNEDVQVPVSSGDAIIPTRDLRQNENIFFFIPNLIGYTRIVLAISSLYYMPVHPRTCSLLYCISCLLDSIDGLAARYFHQSTKFGAVLDMVIDRCTTSCLLAFLAGAFPRWSIIFQGLISLDLASHYMHMYATLSMGRSDQSHKTIDGGGSELLKLYYSNRIVLFCLCAFNELFFVALYLLSFSSPLPTSSILPAVGESTSRQTGSPAIPSVSWTTDWSAGAMETARANKLNSKLPWIFALISVLPMLVKQYLNVVQLVEASMWLGGGDIEQRRKARLQSSR